MIIKRPTAVSTEMFPVTSERAGGRKDQTVAQLPRPVSEAPMYGRFRYSTATSGPRRQEPSRA